MVSSSTLYYIKIAGKSNTTFYIKATLHYITLHYITTIMVHIINYPLKTVQVKLDYIHYFPDVNSTPNISTPVVLHYVLLKVDLHAVC